MLLDSDEVASIEDLLSGDVNELSGSDAAEVLRRLEKVASQVDAARLQVARRFDESGAWAATQARSATQWHAITTGSAKAVSGSLFHLARNAAYMSVAVAAYARAEITQSHLRLLARCVGPRTRVAYWRDEEVLVGEARRLDADAFAKAIDYWLLHADPDGPEPKSDPTRDTVALHRTLGGRWKLKGDFCDETGTRLDALLTERADKIFKRDKHLSSIDDTDLAVHRTTGNRKAQALVELVDAGAATTGGTRRDPAFTVVVDPQTAQGLPTDRPLHETLFGHMVPRSLLEKLRCQATWSVAVLGENGEILRLGRSERYASKAQRRALAIRDGGCVVPGCGAPPEECDAHHIDPYGHPESGTGLTDIDKLGNFCDHHHHRVHDGKLIVTMVNGKPVVTLANGHPLVTRQAA